METQRNQPEHTTMTIMLGIYIAAAAYVLLGCAFTCAMIAEKKGGDGGAWFFWGLLFTVFALVMVVSTDPKPVKS